MMSRPAHPSSLRSVCISYSYRMLFNTNNNNRRSAVSLLRCPRAGDTHAHCGDTQATGVSATHGDMGWQRMQKKTGNVFFTADLL